MLTYLTSAQLAVALISTDETKTLYFQDVALFPAFLHLTAAEVPEVPVGIALTPMFESTKRALRLILPGATFSPGLFVPIGLQLSSVAMSTWLAGFSDLSLRIVGGFNYSVFDDISSDLFVIMPSNTPLAELNSIYTGSHRISPINVLLTLKRVNELLFAITASNTTEIADPNPIASSPIPTPTPFTGTTITVLSRIWTLSRGMSTTSPISQISTPVASSLVISGLNSTAEKLQIEAELNRLMPSRVHVLTNPVLNQGMMGSGNTMQWALQ